MLQQLIQARRTAFMDLLQTQNYPLIKSAIENGYDVNMPCEPSMQYPLIYAVIKKDFTLCDLILNSPYYVDIHVQDEAGLSAYDYAELCDYRDIQARLDEHQSKATVHQSKEASLDLDGQFNQALLSYNYTEVRNLYPLISDDYDGMDTTFYDFIKAMVCGEVPEVPHHADERQYDAFVHSLYWENNDLSTQNQADQQALFEKYAQYAISSYLMSVSTTYRDMVASVLMDPLSDTKYKFTARGLGLLFFNDNFHVFQHFLSIVPLNEPVTLFKNRLFNILQTCLFFYRSQQDERYIRLILSAMQCDALAKPLFYDEPEDDDGLSHGQGMVEKEFFANFVMRKLGKPVKKLVEEADVDLASESESESEVEPGFESTAETEKSDTTAGTLKTSPPNDFLKDLNFDVEDPKEFVEPTYQHLKQQVKKLEAYPPQNILEFIYSIDLPDFSKLPLYFLLGQSAGVPQDIQVLSNRTSRTWVDKLLAKPEKNGALILEKMRRQITVLSELLYMVCPETELKCDVSESSMPRVVYSHHVMQNVLSPENLETLKLLNTATASLVQSHEKIASELLRTLVTTAEHPSPDQKVFIKAAKRLFSLKKMQNSEDIAYLKKAIQIELKLYADDPAYQSLLRKQRRELFKYLDQNLAAQSQSLFTLYSAPSHEEKKPNIADERSSSHGLKK